MRSELSDRERIMLNVISSLQSTAILRPRVLMAYQQPSEDDAGYAHFAKYRKPIAGDLVWAETGSVGKWKLAWYVAPLPGSFGGAVVRSIGDGQECNYTNESFTPIVGLRQRELFEGAQRQFYVKVLGAFGRGDEYMYRFGGLEFDGDLAVIAVREVFGGIIGGGSKPFEVRMNWKGRSSIKSILQALRDGGYGTRQFEPRATETAVEGIPKA